MKISSLLIIALALMTASCNGIFEDIYDAMPESDASDEGFSSAMSPQNRMTLSIDASDFGVWTYVSLKNKSVEKYPIPLTLAGEWDGHSGLTYQEVKGDSFTALSFVPTDPQPEPEEWDFAIHRFDVRTHNGGVASTNLKSIDDARSLAVDDMDFTPDTPADSRVMVDLSDMMAYRIGYQNIESNAVLSQWVTMNISTPPPTFEATGNVYILRLYDGSLAALKMSSYINAKGEKGHLTIDIIYPLQ